MSSKTAEIITLLYEATQGPPLPIDEPPALNPTGGVIGKAPPPVNGLRYQKDPSRQGSGVFVAHGVPTENYRDAPEGLIIQSRGSKGEPCSRSMSHRLFIFIGADGENAEAEYNTSTAGEMPSSAGIVNITPLSGDRAEGSMPNVNPAMDAVMESAAGHVQVMNVLDGPQAPNVLEQLAMTDTGFLEGIPGGMFDWGEFCLDTYVEICLTSLQVNGIISSPALILPLQMVAAESLQDFGSQLFPMALVRRILKLKMRPQNSHSRPNDGYQNLYSNITQNAVCIIPTIA